MMDMIALHRLVIVFISIVLVFIAWLVIFHRRTKLRQRLSIRIASLILLTGPAVLIGILLLNLVYSNALGQAAPWWSRLIQLALIVLGTPLLLGLLAARYVTKPLSEFTRAISSMKDSDYGVRLDSSGVYEFDKVLAEFNELLERLAEEEALRKNLISDTAHELKTPITALIGQLEGMKAGVITKDQEHIDVLLSASHRLEDTAARLVEYARLQSQTLKLTKTDNNLTALVASLQREYEQPLQTAHMHIKTDLEMTTISADQSLLKQLLGNLIQNAIRYSEGSVITISYNGKQLRVADNGTGIADKDLAHIFERFYRVDTSRSRNTGGLGLGLAIVKEIATSHGWRLEAKNTHPGLCFTFEEIFTQDSQQPVLLHSMSRKEATTRSKTTTPLFKDISPWITIGLIAFGLILFTYTAVQQNYRMDANDPQIQMAEDAATAWNAGAKPATLVASTKVDASKSLAPFTVIVDTHDRVLASDVDLSGTTPLPPSGVFQDAQDKGELRFTWQTESGLRFAAVVDPTPNGAVVTARSLREVEQREQQLTLMAGLTLLGVIGVLALAYVVTAR